MTKPTHDEFRTEEEQVARAVDRFGHMVALGRPGDRLPPPGAERSYADDGSWQGEVLAALDRAELVLLTAGPGENLAWEVEQVLRRNDPTRLVLLINHDRSQYEDFAAMMSTRFPEGLPELPKSRIRHWILRGRFVHAAIWFDADWTTHLEMLDGRFPLIGTLRRTQRAIPRALRELYRREGLTVRRKPPIPPTRPWPVAASVTAFTYLWLTTTAVALAVMEQVIQFIARLGPLQSVLASFIPVLHLIIIVFTLPLILTFSFVAYRVWRGGPIATVTLQTLCLTCSLTLITHQIWAISSLHSGFYLGLFAILPLACMTAFPALLLIRHDARMWLQACA